MKQNIVYIDQNQRFNDVLPLIPTNRIIYKTLPGLGATYTELTSLRNSIIIEPNVPVIIGKKKKHNEEQPTESIKVLGVHKGIDQSDVEDFILSDVPYKKIITTPEGFSGKVMPAFFAKGVDCLNDYFLLYDECEKSIQDGNYRSAVILPFEEFFDFTNKAMISATPILPSDPRFKKHSFEIVRITPTFDYRKKLNLLHTNCISAALEQTLKKLEGKCFIFLNGTDVTYQLIKALGIEDESAAFCSEDAVVKLKDYGFLNASSELTDDEGNLKEFSKYNFFTSRFYSAVDIELAYKPNIIIISHLHFAPFTIVDPATEVIQIIGRFRNLTKAVVHITTTNKDFEERTREEALKFLMDEERGYKRLYNLYLDTNEPTHRIALKDALGKYKFNKFTITESRKSYFLMDNFIDEIVVRGYYNSIERLKEAYQATNFFKLRVIDKSYTFTDRDLKQWKKKKANKTLFKEVTEKLTSYSLNSGIANYIKKEHPEMVEAVYRLGKEKLTSLDFNLGKAKTELIKLNASEKKDSTPVRSAVHAAFKLKTDYLEVFIKKRLEEINDEFEIEVPIKMSDLPKKYFRMTGRKTLYNYGKAYGKGYRFYDTI
ncbi:MAG TPA: hypothetical protein VGD22_05660 [Sphingobacteriaceae bacterium]